MTLVQSLLLLSCHDEVSDGLKDTWYHIGVAISIAHTIGLHRNPEKTCMSAREARVRKRIWWAACIRDSMCALRMRRPSRIFEHDVPMLTLADFELQAVPDLATCLPVECVTARDIRLQQELAVMCIEKAKLCVCINHVLSTGYSTLSQCQHMERDQTPLLLPQKSEPKIGLIQSCDEELWSWFDNLSEEAKQPKRLSGVASLDLNRSLLHLTFCAALSTLHRPQILPSLALRHASSAACRIVLELASAELLKFLPHAGVEATVLLPAIITYLLDMRSTDVSRQTSRHECLRCIKAMSSLQDARSFAGSKTLFHRTIIHKNSTRLEKILTRYFCSDEEISAMSELMGAGKHLGKDSMGHSLNCKDSITPPPDSGISWKATTDHANISDWTSSSDEIIRRLAGLLGFSTPAEGQDGGQHHVPDTPASFANAWDDNAAHILEDGMFHDATDDNFPIGEASGDDFATLFEDTSVPDSATDDALESELFLFMDTVDRGSTTDMDWHDQ